MSKMKLVNEIVCTLVIKIYNFVTENNVVLNNL